MADLRVIPPSNFNYRLGTIDDPTPEDLDALVPALVKDLKVAKHPDEVKNYLEDRAADMGYKADKDPKLKTLAEQISKLAAAPKLDAGLFAGMLKLTFAVGSRVEAEEVDALVELKDWLIDHTKNAEKKSLYKSILSELELIGPPLTTDEAQPKVDAMVESVRTALDLATKYHEDEVDPSTLTRSVKAHEVSKATLLLMSISPKGVGRKSLLDPEKIDWYEKARAVKEGDTTIDLMTGYEVPAQTLAQKFPDVDLDLIDKYLPDIKKQSEFLEDALPGFSIVKVRPDAIPDPEIQAAAKVAAAVINDKSSKNDAEELNATELQQAVTALGPDGDPAIRQKLVKKYHEVRNARIDGDFEAKAAESLLRNLEVVLDFMTDENNTLMRSGFAVLEVGDWSQPWRKPGTKVAGFFPLPNEKGELNYKVKDFAEAEKIHAKYADDLKQTELNAVTFMFEDKVWVAVYPYGDLEGIEPGRSEIPLFDIKVQDDDELDYRNLGSGKVIGKVDPLYSSGGEAFWRTGHRFVKTIVDTVSNLIGNPETRAKKVTDAVQKGDNKVFQSATLLTALGVTGATAINPAFLWGFLGFAVAPSAVNLAGYAVSHRQLRPIYELLGTIVKNPKKL